MKRILLVDDDRSVLQFLGRVLSGYQVTFARDGFEALAATESLDRLDLLITDYFMPEMFGDELIARARERRPNLPVIVMTGHGPVFDRDAPLWWQSNAHLDKPIQVDALRERVSMLIGDAPGVDH